MNIRFFKKPGYEVKPNNGLEAIVKLVQLYRLPIDREMLMSFGKTTGLGDEDVCKILNNGLLVAFAADLEFKKWCLNQIVSILIGKHGKIEEGLYKRLVNVVNGLGLSFGYLDRSIRQEVRSVRS